MDVACHGTLLLGRLNGLSLHDGPQLLMRLSQLAPQAGVVQGAVLGPPGVGALGATSRTPLE